MHRSSDLTQVYFEYIYLFIYLFIWKKCTADNLYKTKDFRLLWKLAPSNKHGKMRIPRDKRDPALYRLESYK